MSTGLTQPRPLVGASTEHGEQDLHAAADLLGLSFSSPPPFVKPLPPGSLVAQSKPVPVPTRKSARRGGNELALSGSGPASFSSAASSFTSSAIEKKKVSSVSAGLVAGVKKEGVGIRSSSRASIPPKLYDSPSPSPVPVSLVRPGPPNRVQSMPTPSSLPVHGHLLASMEDDGEIPEEELKNPKGGRRRSGSVFRCESCSKVYRHPSCLVKHRWQHSPHWHESSKLSLSKHQQVQVLEAASILVHLDPVAGTSLPEDKSLWPAAVSPAAHPAPSITYLESRQKSKATSTYQSNRPNASRRGSAKASTSTPPGTDRDITTVTVDGQRADSPGSSSNNSTDQEHGDADSGYGTYSSSLHQQAAAPTRPTGLDVRRTSFGSVGTMMGAMRLDPSVPARSPGGGLRDAALPSSSSARGVGAGSIQFNGGSPARAHAGISLSRSPGNAFGSSPSGLQMLANSSLRVSEGFSVQEEDEEEEDDSSSSPDGGRSKRRITRRGQVDEDDDDERAEDDDDRMDGVMGEMDL